MEKESVDLMINLCGFAVIMGIGFGLLGLRRLGWLLAIGGFVMPGLVVMKVTLGPAALQLYEQWWSEQTKATQTLISAAGWGAIMLITILSVLGVFRLFASLFIGRSAADSLVANLASDSIRGIFRGLFRWIFGWRR